ncbi:MAG: hypothetical protein Q7S95_04380 [bacterium]|nr:hypothetical protein [bacterium]
MKDMTEVQAARLAAMNREFSFLGRYIKNAVWLGAVPKVKRIDLNVLEGCGHTYAWSHGKDGYQESVWYNSESRYVFIGTDGSEIAAPRQRGAEFVRAAPSIWNLWRPKRKPVFSGGETVLEALRRFEDPNEVAYVLYVHDKWNREAELPPRVWSVEMVNSSGLTIIIYKVPVGQTLGSWVERLSEAADRELRAHLAELDKV